MNMRTIVIIRILQLRFIVLLLTLCYLAESGNGQVIDSIVEKTDRGLEILYKEKGPLNSRFFLQPGVGLLYSATDKGYDDGGIGPSVKIGTGWELYQTNSLAYVITFLGEYIDYAGTGAVKYGLDWGLKASNVEVNIGVFTQTTELSSSLNVGISGSVGYHIPLGESGWILLPNVYVASSNLKEGDEFGDGITALTYGAKVDLRYILNESYSTEYRTKIIHDSYVKGRIYDVKTSEPIIAEIKVVDKDENVIEKVSSQSDGRYSLKVPGDQSYHFRYTKAGYSSDSVTRFVSGKNTDGPTIDIGLLPTTKQTSKQVFVLNGVVTSCETQNPVNATVRIIDPITGDQYGDEIRTDEEGYYRTTLESGKKYSVLIESKGYIPSLEEVHVRVTRDQGRETQLRTRDFNVCDSVNLNVLFDFGKYRYSDESNRVISSYFRRLVKYLSENDDVVIMLEGHTDNIGDTESNMTLSRKRAAEIKSYLLELGVDESQLQSDGYGEDRPIMSNDTPEGRAKNRRVHLKKVYR